MVEPLTCLSPRLLPILAAYCEITFTSLQRQQPKGSLCFPSATGNLCVLTSVFRALWRCECKSSQPSSVPKQVLAFKAPAVCIATWLELPCFAASSVLFFDTLFFSSTRGIISVGTADGSLHLVDPNSWRCHIRRIQAHKLYVAMLPGMHAAHCLTFH